MRSIGRTGLLTLTAISLTVVLVGSGIKVAQAETSLRFGYVQAPESPTGRGVSQFAQLVSVYTGGSVKVEQFPSSQLGGNRKLMGQVRSGAIDMSLSPYPILADIVPEFSAYTAGYFYDNWSHVSKVVNHPELGKAWDKQLEEKTGLIVLSSYYYGARTLTTTKTPVRSPQDMNGLKIRAVPNPMSLAVISGLGAAPTPVAFAELFQALRQGVVDGQENPLPTIWATKFYEVQDYLVLTLHQTIPIPFIINNKAWSKLSDQEKAALSTAAKQATAWISVETIAEEAKLVDQLKEKGMKVVGPEDGLDIEAFRKSVRASVLSKFDGEIWPSGLADKVLQVAHQ